MRILNYTSSRRRNKSLVLKGLINTMLKENKRFAIGTESVDTRADQIKEWFPDAKVTKFDRYVVVENE